jgi:hypothetical protein
MPEIGAVQMLAGAFGPDANLEGTIVDELAKLERERTIRILDLLFVRVSSPPASHNVPSVRAILREVVTWR